jgi:hypothetical protein
VTPAVAAACRLVSQPAVLDAAVDRIAADRPAGEPM